MNGRARVLLGTLALLAIPTAIRCQNVPGQDNNKGAKGSITGRVTKDGNPGAGAVVVVFRASQYSSSGEALARVRADQDGRYHISEVSSGECRVAPLVPGYVIPDAGTGMFPGLLVRVPDGGDVDGIDFSLVRGAVITGRVTDQDGIPLSGQSVTLHVIDDYGHMRSMFELQSRTGTDDQGIYRAYGLPAGRYLVSVGMDPKQGGAVGARRSYSQTFSPGVADQAKARQVNVTQGTEETGVDIKVGPIAITHTANGRIVDAESGAPMPNIRYGLGHVSMSEDGRSGVHGFISVGSTNASGGFRIEGLLQAKYFITAVLDDPTGLYSDIKPFEISDQDVTGLEVRVHRGSAIVGRVLVDGVDDSVIADKISQFELSAWLLSSDNSIDNSSASRRAQVNADGSFRFTGLRPGKFGIALLGTPQAKGFSLKLMQGQGVQDAPARQAEGGQIIEVGEDQILAGLQVVLSYSNGIIRGQIKVEGGELPPGTHFEVSAYRVNGSSSHGPIEVDGNGRFVIDGLQPGDYSVGVAAISPAGGRYDPLGSAEQMITVKNGSESEAPLVINLSERRKKDR